MRYAFLILAAAAFLFVAQPASAQIDRPDLAQGAWLVDLTSSAASTVRYFDGGAVLDQFWETYHSSPSDTYAYPLHYVAAWGSATATTASGHGDVAWWLYGPDSVKRKSDGGKLKQSDYLAVFVHATVTGTISTTIPGQSIVARGCKAQAGTKDKDGGPSTLKLKLKCKDLFGPSALDLNPTQQAALARLFGVTEFDEAVLSGKFDANRVLP